MGGRRRPSIHDVADAANVSITTVSHALSGKGRLPAETRDLVRRAAEQLGYAPSRNARSLVTGRSMLLGIQASGFGPQTLIPDLAYFTDILNAASTAALERDYALVVLPPRAPADTVRHMAFDGAAIIDPLGDESLLEVLVAERRPVVTTGRVLHPAVELPFVDTDHHHATRLVLDHLRDRGYRRPAVLTGGRGLSYVHAVTSAYREWCAEQAVPEQVVEVDGPLTEESGHRAMAGVLASTAAVDCVYATLDVLAVGALAAARDAGVDVPTQLGVAAITDSPLLRVSRPTITALDLHPVAIGTLAVSILVDAVEGERWHAGELVRADLVPRSSTAGRGVG